MIVTESILEEMKTNTIESLDHAYAAMKKVERIEGPVNDHIGCIVSIFKEAGLGEASAAQLESKLKSMMNTYTETIITSIGDECYKDITDSIDLITGKDGE